MRTRLRWMPLRKSGRAVTSSVFSIRRTVTKRRSIRRSCRTGRISRTGRIAAQYGPRSGPTRSGKQILEEFEAPPMDEAIHEELKDFVERRKSEGGAPHGFLATLPVYRRKTGVWHLKSGRALFALLRRMTLSQFRLTHLQNAHANHYAVCSLISRNHGPPCARNHVR